MQKMAWNAPFQGNEENFDMFQKWEKVLYVYNISLCDESKPKNISENAYIKLLNRHISENKFPPKGLCT